MAVLILGDVGIDKNFHGAATELSPEGPYPVVKVQTITENLSCAGNIVKSLVEFFDNVYFITCLKESETQRLKERLNENVIHLNVTQTDRTMQVINRIMVGNYCVSRFDEGRIVSINENSESKIIAIVEQIIANVEVVILSDYDLGLLTSGLCERIIDLSNVNSVPVLVDPFLHNWEKFKNATLIKPNRVEASSFLGKPISNDIFREFASTLLNTYGIRYILCTMDEDGMILGYGEEKEVKTIEKSTLPSVVCDVIGCGDALIAAIAVFYSRNKNGFPNAQIEMVDLLTKAGSIAVSKPGCYHLNMSDWNAICGDHKANKKVVFTNGCFDILHAAHIYLLTECKKKGDHLVVAINSDESVSRLKGETRPINTLIDRMAVLLEIGVIDELIPFEEDTPINLIRSIQPDLLVKGGDYSLEEVVGRQYAKETLILAHPPHLNKLSSTEIISRCVNKNANMSL